MQDDRPRFIKRVARPRTTYAYQVRDAALWRLKFARPISLTATRRAGSILASHAQRRFPTDVTIAGEESGAFRCTTLL